MRRGREAPTAYALYGQQRAHVEQIAETLYGQLMFDVTVVVFSFMAAVGLVVVVVRVVSESEGSNVVAIVVCCVFGC